MFVKHNAPNYFLVYTKCQVEKGHNSDKINPQVNQVIFSWPSFRGSWDILLTRFSCAKLLVWKGDIIWSNSYKSFPKFNQIIYTLVPNCLQNCMSLTQAIFCLQDFHLLKCLSLKRGLTPPWRIWQTRKKKKKKKKQVSLYFTFHKQCIYAFEISKS